MNVMILGTRGIPAQHGGFETFAEEFAFYLVERGHQITVFCQAEDPLGVRRDVWRGIHRIFVHGPAGPVGTMQFDWRSVLIAAREPGVVLTLGYNTAVFSVLYRLLGKQNIINMDGIEWRREKWTRTQRMWLKFNEFAGAKLANHLVADHPEIGKHHEKHVNPDKITVIPYGADSVSGADPSFIAKLNLMPRTYSLVVARPEPENSILEIVQAYSSKARNMPLVVLGRFAPDRIPYHKKVLEAAGPEVIFPGGIYDKRIVAALRFYCCTYIHGHQVGGTNPSLVESLAAGTATIAHNNRFTRWVAGDGASYFEGAADLSLILDEILKNDSALETMRCASRLRYSEAFTQEQILGHYELLLSRFAPKTEIEQSPVLNKQLITAAKR